jgi:hypothetical protein
MYLDWRSFSICYLGYKQKGNILTFNNKQYKFRSQIRILDIRIIHRPKVEYHKYYKYCLSRDEYDISGIVHVPYTGERVGMRPN